MTALFNDRFAFVHVPKTGGTWVAVALKATISDLQEPVDPKRRGHFTWDQLPNHFRFGFVRDPVTWYASHWRHRKTHEDWNGSQVDEAIRKTRDFAGFVRTVTSEHPGFLSAMYEAFLGPPGAVQFIGRYENLVDDLVTAVVLSGEAYDLELVDFEALRGIWPVNTAESKVELTPELREMIAASEHEAMGRFGYTMTGSEPEPRPLAARTASR